MMEPTKAPGNFPKRGRGRPRKYVDSLSQKPNKLPEDLKRPLNPEDFGNLPRKRRNTTTIRKEYPVQFEIPGEVPDMISLFQNPNSVHNEVRKNSGSRLKSSKSWLFEIDIPGPIPGDLDDLVKDSSILTNFFEDLPEDLDR